MRNFVACVFHKLLGQIKEDMKGKIPFSKHVRISEAVNKIVLKKVEFANEVIKILVLNKAVNFLDGGGVSFENNPAPWS
jgi:hypothetical protein